MTVEDESQDLVKEPEEDASKYGLKLKEEQEPAGLEYYNETYEEDLELLNDWEYPRDKKDDELIGDEE